MNKIIFQNNFSVNLLLPILFSLLLLLGCKDSIPGKDSMTSIDKSNQQPVKTIQDNCTDKCHKTGTFMDPVLINGEGMQGKHKKHVGERGLYCTTCHYNYSSMESHRNNVLDTDNPEVQIVFFNPINWNPEDDRKGEWVDDEGLSTGGCASLYCHGKREKDIGIPRWYEDVSYECTYCHNLGAPIDPTTNYESFPAEKHSTGFIYNGEACTSCHPGFVTSELVPANAHTRHVTDVGFACEMCHMGYKEKESHANGELDSAEDVIGKINFDPILNPKGEYDPASKACSNLYCHGDAWGDESNSRNSISKGTDTTPVWTDLSSGDCGNCHLADTTHNQGAHAKHLSPPYSFPCYKCHFDNRGKTRKDGSVLTRQDHHVKEGMPINGVVNVIFDKSTLPANPTGLFDQQNKTCSSLYCHGSKLPLEGTGSDTIPNWEWGANGSKNSQKPNPWCGTCHDTDLYDSSDTTIRATGRHILHLADPADSSERPKNGPGIEGCTRCHPGSYSSTETKNSTTYVQASTHVNGIIDYTDSSVLGEENFWTSQSPSGAMVDFVTEEAKSCTTAGCHTEPPLSVDFVHSNLKKKASYNTTLTPNAPADISGTAVCNNCHSPEGDYNGVTDPVIGSKFNWLEGVYATGSGEDFTHVDQTELKAGKEKWCAGCHDKSPSMIDTKFEGSDVTVDAPQVIGDETDPTNYGMGWGFYKTGHGVLEAERMPWTGTKASRDVSGNWSADGRPGPGKQCTACHNPKLPHIDGKHRTFDCTDTSLCEPEYYQSGYRLRKVNDNPPLEVPRTRVVYGNYNIRDLAEYQVRLCFQCHESSRFLTSDGTTNFRSDGRGNLHEMHLNQSSAIVDADWRLNLFGISNYPSGTGLLCITCHNVHGSNQLAMIRDGSLTNGRMMKMHYKDATTVTIPDPGYGNACHEIDILEATSDPGILLGDSDGSVFCDNVQYYQGSGMCQSHCHGSFYDFERGVDRTPPYPLTTPN